VTDPTPLPSPDEERLLAALRTPPAEPMPDDVWVSVQRSIATEQAARSSRTSKKRHPGRWLSVAAAAAVVVVLGGVWINSNKNPAPITAEDQSAIALANPSSAQIVTAGFPARKVMASHTNYSKDHLREQVNSMLSSLGVHDMDDAMTLPQPRAMETTGQDGFTATIEGLRDCLTAITKNAKAQALVVDRALFEGVDAGVLVMPAGTAAEDSPAPTLTSKNGQLDVWVVDPACDVVDPHVLMHTLHELADSTP